jgi:hypothetical protein
MDDNPFPHLNAWCFGCNTAAVAPPGEKELRCGTMACNGVVRRIENRAALEAGLLANRMAQGHYVHSAAIWIASRPRAIELLPPVQPGHPAPIGHVLRNDGTSHVFDFEHYLTQTRTNPSIAQDFNRIWLIGAYIQLGDALAQSRYFDRVPELELIRHIRNGIAHGNRFRIDNLDSLTKRPAHNRFASVRAGAPLDIVPSVHGKEVLFSFAGPADLLDLLMSAEVHLVRLGLGDPRR